MMRAMYLAYVDDSGDSRHGTTLTALLVDDQHWAGVLEAWLTGRRAVHREFGVRKNAELHATALYGGRGRWCETAEQERQFGATRRAATGRIVLSHLAAYEHFFVVTVAGPVRGSASLYARFVAYLEDWAATSDTRMMIFYDGQQGLPRDPTSTSPDELADLWETAVRGAAPYRRVHRDLDLTTRRVVEDVIMQDSRYSQLIQATDLMAYGAYQHHRQENPQIWGTRHAPVPAAIRAYLKTRQHWLPGTDDSGVVWLD